MNVQAAYDHWSGSYDADENLTRDLDRTVTESQLGGLRVKSLLELGCGTGKNSRFLASLADRMAALDFSAAMMAQAQHKTTGKAVGFCRVDLTISWPFAEGAFELLSANLVLEHIQDLDFVFSEAGRALAEGGRFYLSELHPFRQYQGKKAIFRQEGETHEITAFVHHLSDFLEAAAAHEFRLLELKEWWHAADQGKPPRLVTLLFEKQGVFTCDPGAQVP